MIKKSFLLIFFIFGIAKSVVWNDLEREFIARGTDTRYDVYKVFDILSDMKDEDLKLVFLIKIMIINFEIECNSEISSNYYQSIYKKKEKFSIRLDASSFLNYERYSKLKKTVVDKGDLGNDVDILLGEYKTLQNENDEIEKLFFDFLKIDIKDKLRFEKIGSMLAELVQNTDD